MRTFRVALTLALALLAYALPARALGATATLTAVESKAVTPAQAVEDIPRYRLYFGTKVTLQGVVVRDDGQPAAGVTLTLSRQVADASVPAGFTISPVGDPLVTDAAGAFTRQVKPDRITYYYVTVAPQPELGVALQTLSPRIGLLVAPRIVQTSNPKQKGASFRVSGRVLMPEARSLGWVVIERLKGEVARQVARKQAKADGTFRIPLRHTKNGTYRYRLSFRPTDGNRLIASSIVFSIRVTSIEPPEGTTPAP